MCWPAWPIPGHSMILLVQCIFGYCMDVKHHEFPSSFLMKCLLFNGARWKSSLLQLLWEVVMALGASVQ